MGVAFAKRAAAQILNRGKTAIRIMPGSVADAEKALTRDDVRKLIEKGSIYATKEKHNASSRSKMLKLARQEGRRRGPGRRRGTANARSGRTWEKKIRSQRRLLSELREMGKIDSKTFQSFYRHTKGNEYATKANMILHLREIGIEVTDDEIKAINGKIRKEYE